MAVKKEIHPYKRKITHEDYLGKVENIRDNAGIGLLRLNISDPVKDFAKETLDEGGVLDKLSDSYIKKSVAAYVLPQTIGGISFIFFLVTLYSFVLTKNKETNIPIAAYIIMTISLSITIFFVYYYLSMPKKECIFNREDGLLTIPGMMWNPNATMPFNKVMFTYTGPSAQGLGAYMLQIMRPDKYYSRYLCSFGFSCYEDLSFWVWYMDKNRPLPPGTAFDPYRQKDYERRKAAGFPKPLYPASFDTPEATPEQQAERKRIGGW